MRGASGSWPASLRGCAYTEAEAVRRHDKFPSVASVRDYLHRYWFRWDGEPPRELSPAAVLGYGVTGFDRRDAEKLLSATLLSGAPLPAGADVIENVDVRELDEGHVLPNMGDPSVRGVWYPRV